MSKSPTAKLLQLTKGFGRLVCIFLCGTCLTARAEPPTPWQEDVTPDKFIRCFADFSFELAEPVQDAETFLRRKRGDCDDFAKLAAATLSQRGYKTKVVVVMMAEQTHVVCYVAECKGYLDYNLRAAAEPIVACDGSLEDIAEKVAVSFHSNWRMASEVRYDGATPVFVYNTFPPARRESVPTIEPATVKVVAAPSASLASAAVTPKATAELKTGPAAQVVR